MCCGDGNLCVTERLVSIVTYALLLQAERPEDLGIDIDIVGTAGVAAHGAIWRDEARTPGKAGRAVIESRLFADQGAVVATFDPALGEFCGWTDTKAASMCCSLAGEHRL